MDTVSPETRSRMMRAIKGVDTGPEMVVRRMVHAMGFRYRMHRRDLPGKPDLVFPRLRKVIMVHGCFWHRHEGCPFATVPRTRPDFWEAKFCRNVERDRTVRAALEALGWEILVVWECQTDRPADLRRNLSRFLGSRSEPGGRPGNQTLDCAGLQNVICNG